MRPSHSKARQHEPEREGCGTYHAASLRNRFDPLALPKLELGATDHVPCREFAQLALQFLNAGYLDDNESLLGTSSADLVVLALNRCIEKHKGETPLLTDLSFHLHVATPPELWNTDGEYCPEEINSMFVSQWFYSIETDGMESRLLEPRYNVVEPKAPGLFRTALLKLETCVNPFVLSGTPNTLRAVMADHMWGGMDDNEAFFEECMCSEEAEEEFDGVSPKSFRNGLPNWLVQPMESANCSDPDPGKDNPILNEDEIAGYAKHADPEIAAIATCLMDFDSATKVMKEEEFGFYMLAYLYPVFMLTLLRWNRGDNLRHAYDEFLEMANGCMDSYNSTVAQTFVGRDDESFKKWIRGFEAALIILNRANTLIELISVPDDN